MNQFEALIDEKKIRIVIDQEHDCDVWSDEVLLEPILFNLISNAIKYSPPQSEVQIHIESYVNKMVAIKVRDYGCGIPKELHEKIFDRFYRVQNDHSHRTKGNGLGLYLVRYFGEKIGTKISFWSEVGLGSQFTLYIERFRKQK